MSYTPQSPGPYPGGPEPTQPDRNTKALTSMILALVGIPLSLFCIAGPLLGLAAVVLALVARREIAATGGAQPGSSMATTGLVVGAIEVVAFIGLLVFYALR